MTVATAELAIVMNRMVIARGSLKGEKMRCRDAARWDVERLVERKVLKIPGRLEAVARGIEGLLHGFGFSVAGVLICARSCFAAHRPARSPSVLQRRRPAGGARCR